MVSGREFRLLRKHLSKYVSGKKLRLLRKLLSKTDEASDTVEKTIKTARLANKCDAPNITVTRFITNAEGKTVDLGPTLERIAKGERFPHRNDGAIFRNREGLLPSKPEGYYREYVHPTPNVRGPGPQRIVIGENGELFFTADHYSTFIPLNPGG